MDPHNNQKPYFATGDSHSEQLIWLTTYSFQVIQLDETKLGYDRNKNICHVTSVRVGPGLRQHRTCVTESELRVELVLQYSLANGAFAPLV